ncbi:hypothetical protein NUU61_003476 [Penicillium alfredii]|uniref:Uncharacterized protein n=1 Tax=Penicillium alfredii TaxID=1506179 RepID=A0A9W9FJG8_9EURO|nr:uncharacterized protein NUU61_003476 [Penicillium alfredii]KAJ5101254.1 hypothetical protein NUU61_003476 [Penicillium alfredii]
MDRFGCRVLLMVSAAGLSLCFIMVAMLLSFGQLQTAYGATAFIFLFQIFYGLGWLPVSLVLSIGNQHNTFTTKSLELEDVNLIFAKGGFTGGVFSSRGRTVVPHQHAQETEIGAKQETDIIEYVQRQS